ncbi:MAG: MucR family transcriptional regulator [Syntrophobacteraceae bacterium]|nr:MucR family transcriptional regulator [Syntrophobacteraceae bacterium]
MKKLLDIAAEIVQAQASVAQLSAEQIEQSLIKTFSTLQRMRQAEEKGLLLEGEPAGAMPVVETGPAPRQPRESIQDERIFCLECGTQMRQLTSKHLSEHNLTPKEYKQKWGFSMKQPLSAKSLTKARSKAAKKRGLPPNLVKFLEEKKRKMVEAAVALDLGNERKEGKSSVKTSPKAGKTA